MSALRAIGWVLLITFTTAIVVGIVFAVIYVLSPIAEYRSLSTQQLSAMGMQFGMPIGELLGAVSSIFIVLSEKRPALDYALAGAVGGALAANGGVLLFTLGDGAGNGPVIALAGLVTGALIGTFRNKFWSGTAARS